MIYRVRPKRGAGRKGMLYLGPLFVHMYIYIQHESICLRKGGAARSPYNAGNKRAPGFKGTKAEISRVSLQKWKQGRALESRDDKKKQRCRGKRRKV